VNVLNESICTLYSWFKKSSDGCPYFSKHPDSFGILLKGKSIELLPNHVNSFKDCFVVNNFDKEIEVVGESLVGKNCVHFVNRLMTAPLEPENYENYGITDVQLIKTSAFGDRGLVKTIRHYESLGLQTHLLPKKMLEFNTHFSKEYRKKAPNAGALAIAYALELIQPKVLWIIGMDFYQSDYLIRRPHQNPIEVQRAKMNRINIVEIMAVTFKRHPKIAINMVSYYKGFPEVPNVKFIRN